MRETVRIISSRHEGVARLGAREDASVQRVARLGTGEVPLVFARDNSVLVYTLGSTPNHGLEVFPKVGRLEVGIEFGGEMVAQVLGVLRVVVAADAPRVLVFGEVAGNELDRIEGVCFTGLAGCEDAAVDCLLGNLANCQYASLQMMAAGVHT